MYRVTVYPRVCGGTMPQDLLGVVIDGLSPRVRGNQRSNSVPCTVTGSIPACAGEPCGYAGSMASS